MLWRVPAALAPARPAGRWSWPGRDRGASCPDAPAQGGPVVPHHAPIPGGRLVVPGRRRRARAGPAGRRGGTGPRRLLVDRGAAVLVAGRDPRHRRGDHRVPADLLHRPPAGGVPPPGPPRPGGQRRPGGRQHLRHRHPVRGHPGGARPVLEALPGHGAWACSAGTPTAATCWSPWSSPSCPSAILGVAVRQHDRGRAVRPLAHRGGLDRGRRADPGAGAHRAGSPTAACRPRWATTASPPSPTARP